MSYRAPINSSQGPNVLYTMTNIIDDVSQYMTNGSSNGALDQFSNDLINAKFVNALYAGTSYTTNYGSITFTDLLTKQLIPKYLAAVPIDTNSNLTSSGALTNAINGILGEFNGILMGDNALGYEMGKTNKTLSDKKASSSQRNSARNAVNNNFNRLQTSVTEQITSVINSYNPTCTVFTPVTIGDQLGSTYNTANSSCAQAIQAAGQAGQLAGGSSEDLVGYDDLVNYWTEVDNQWSTVKNEQIGTNLSPNPDYAIMNNNLTNINTTCINAAAAYQSYITAEMASAMAPAPFQRPPDTGVTTIINDTVKQYYETEMSYLQGLESQLQEVLNYLTALNIPTVNGSSNSVIGSKTVLNLNAENVAFSAPTNPPTSIITVSGNPGQQTLNMVLSNGMAGAPGSKGPIGNDGANGVSGKDGQSGSPGIFEIPYQYFKSF